MMMMVCTASLAWYVRHHSERVAYCTAARGDQIGELNDSCRTLLTSTREIDGGGVREGGA